MCRLGGARLARLRAALEAGPAAWGWREDQRWTLARVTTLTGRLFHVRYTLRGTSYLLHRLGCTPRAPACRAGSGARRRSRRGGARRGRRHEADYAGLIAASHKELRAPVILIWDNLNTHVSAAMGRFVGAHPDWLAEVRLSACAPGLSAAGGAWANMTNGLGNLAVRDVDQLAAVVRNQLERIQHRPALIGGFLAPAGLTLEPGPP